MKVYVTARFKGAKKKDIEQLCRAIRDSGFEDFSFIRDIENYQKKFDDPKDLWESAKKEIAKCELLLIDISDTPSGGRVVEAGIAYGLGIPIIIVVKRAVEFKDFYNGIATKIIVYDTYPDITKALKEL